MTVNPFVDASAAGMLTAVAERFPEREALVATDRRVTYAEMLHEAQRFARAFLALGVARNDKVALWLPNRPAWLFAQYGAAMIGAVVVALNPRYRAHELGYILKQADVTTLLLTDHLGPVDFLETLGEVLPGLARATPGELALERSRFSSTSSLTPTIPIQAVCGSPTCWTWPMLPSWTPPSPARARAFAPTTPSPSSSRRAPRPFRRAR